MCNLICGESAATEKVLCCFSLIVKRTTAISRKRKQCPMSPQRRDKDKDAFNSPKSAGENKRISICTFITINREFQIRLGTRRRIHCESQTNEDNLLHEWKAYETQPSTDASRMRHFFSLVWVFFLIWQNMMIRFTSTAQALDLFPDKTKSSLAKSTGKHCNQEKCFFTS